MYDYNSQLPVQLDENAIMPERAHEYDAGMDFFAMHDFVVPAHGCVFHDTGVHVELPKRTCGHICSKSGLNRYHGITADGTVDTGYSGTVGMTLHNDGDQDYTFKRGDKIAQMVIELIIVPQPVQVDEVVGGDRGKDGYGSTGK